MRGGRGFENDQFLMSSFLDSPLSNEISENLCQKLIIFYLAPDDAHLRARPSRKMWADGLFGKGPSTKDVRQMGRGVVLKFRTFPDGGRRGGL